MGRFHRHPDGTIHTHDHDDHEHEHDPRSTTRTTHEHGHRDVGDHSGYVETGTRSRRRARGHPLRERPHRRREPGRLLAAGVRSRQPDVVTRRRQDDAVEAHARDAGEHLRIGILEGDIATSLDADQLDADAARRSRW